jgi:general secretion pathway protein D
VLPETQFRVFSLRHAAAETAETQVQNMYADRGDTVGKVRVTADYRSNSLIVQAAPRDIAEVAELIGRIDTPTSAAINELRLFHLENSLAADLAPILQEAVNAQSTSSRGRTGGDTTMADRPRQTPGASGGSSTGRPGSPSTGGTSGSAANSQLALAKSTMLRFLTVDASGKRHLNSGILTDVRITADTRANALLVSAPADSMELLEALIHQLDKLPTAESEVKVFAVGDGDATKLKDLLESLFGQQQQQRSADQPAVRTGAAEGESTLVPLRFAADVRTNCIIATGTAGDLGVVEAILTRLSDSDVRNRKSIVYQLRNARAVQVAEAINEFLKNKRDIESSTSGTISAFEEIEREVVVVAEAVSNSLIVSATPRFFDEIEKIVKDLDKQLPMVMIQVLIAQVDLNNFDEFGIELGLQDSLLFDRSLLGTLAHDDELSPGFNFNNQSLGNSGSTKSLATAKDVGTQGLSSFGVARSNDSLGYGGLVLSASSESVSVLVRALQQCGKLEVLSKPQIMTMHNQEAFVQVGQEIGLISGNSVNEAGQSNQITQKDIGLILRVKPQINPEGLVVMWILAEKSALGAEADGTPVAISSTGAVIRQPPINTTRADTVVAAMDGQTVILGGLITKTKQEEHRRVPYLADIPVLGHLFRYDSHTDHRSEMLIIMTPHIVRSEKEADAIRQVEASRMHWCLGDVIDVGGDVALRGRGDDWSDANTPVFYPDMKSNGETVPTPKDEEMPLQPIPEDKSGTSEPPKAPEPPVLPRPTNPTGQAK